MGTIRTPAPKRALWAPIVVAACALGLAIGVALLLRGSTRIGPAGGSVASHQQQVAAPDWGFVLSADEAQVLRHRPGLTPESFIRTHAFGWDGPTIAEVQRDPLLMRVLRRADGELSVIQLIRSEARGR
jgi:hypothetical protein